MAASASDSGSRPPRISWLAACTIERVTARSQETGRSLRKTPCFWPRFDQGLQLVEHREVAPVELLGREPRRVEGEETVELPELPPGGAEHSLQRLHRLAALGLGASHRLDDLPDRVFHDRVEQRLARREVDVDRSRGRRLRGERSPTCCCRDRSPALRVRRRGWRRRCGRRRRDGAWGRAPRRVVVLFAISGSASRSGSAASWGRSGAPAEGLPERPGSRH